MERRQPCEELKKGSPGRAQDFEGSSVKLVWEAGEPRNMQKTLCGPRCWPVWGFWAGSSLVGAIPTGSAPSRLRLRPSGIMEGFQEEGW